MRKRQHIEPEGGARPCNVCEHGDHAAPSGRRFCSEPCETCEHSSYANTNGCVGLCNPGGSNLLSMDEIRLLRSVAYQEGVQDERARAMAWVRLAKAPMLYEKIRSGEDYSRPAVDTTPDDTKGGT